MPRFFVLVLIVAKLFSFGIILKIFFMKAYIYTLGCRVNQSESMMIADSLASLGVEISSAPEDADLMVVNSCALTESAEAKTRRAIKDFRRKNPNAKICATGCYAQTNAESLREVGVGLIVSNARKSDVPRLAYEFALSGRAEQSEYFNSQNAEARFLEKLNYSQKDLGFLGDTPVSDRANLKIQDGCDNACAYCIIPRARGLPRSRSVEDIVKDAENLASRGVAEIILTGINLSKFSGSLASLANRINSIQGIKRIAFGSIEPPVKEVEILCAMMKDSSHKLARHFHISLQSACSKTLKNMGRKYGVGDFFGMVDFIKSADENIGIGTDVICGFPEESEEDFEETFENIKKSKLNFLHVFTYSPRPGTLAALKPQIPMPIRKRRSDALRVLGETLKRKFFESQEGREEFVLLENRLPSGVYLGYASNYVQTAVKIGKSGLKNQMCKVKIGTPIGSGRVKAEFLELV